MMPAAVLMDMDGTLVDTEPFWVEVETELVASHGGTWTTQDALSVVGSALPDAASVMRERGGLDLPTEEIVSRLLDGVVARIEQQVPWRPGARELLADLRAHHVPCALVTMSYERFVGPVLARLPRGSFDVVITGDAVERGKPHPEPYLHAARLLGVDPATCVAIEDSENGTRSAVAAGCVVLVVPAHVEVAEGERRVRVETLTGLTAADLAALTSR